MRSLTLVFVLVLLGAVACNDDKSGQHDLSIPDLGKSGDAHLSMDQNAGPGSTCDTAIDLTARTTPLAANTATGQANDSAGCAMDSNSSNALYFTYDAGSSAVDVLVDVVVDAAAPWDSVVSARTLCSDPTSETVCANTGGNGHLELLGVMGVVSIVVDGTAAGNLGNNGGAFTIIAKKRAIVTSSGGACDPLGIASRCDANLACKASKCVTTSAALECSGAIDLTAQLASGSATVTTTFLPFQTDYYDGSCSSDRANMVMSNDAETLFKFTVAVPSSLDASTDDMNVTDFDTYVYLRQGACDGTELGCADDVDATNSNYRSDLMVPVLQPGTYYLFVDTSSQFSYGDAARDTRTFKLTVTLRPTAIDGGADM